VFVPLYTLGLLVICILSIRVSLETRKPKWYWPLVLVERPLLFGGLALIAFRVELTSIRAFWAYVAWFLLAAFVVESYYDVITYEPKNYGIADSEASKGQEVFALCMGTLLSVVIVFPAYAMNLAWAYGYM